VFELQNVLQVLNMKARDHSHTAYMFLNIMGKALTNRFTTIKCFTGRVKVASFVLLSPVTNSSLTVPVAGFEHSILGF
jgi:hypothetical protein